MGGSNSGQRPEILIVEDSLTQATVLQHLLTEQNYSVRTVANGVQALEALEERIPDLMVTDVMMPEMDGYQLCAAVKEAPQTRDLPVLLLTSLSEAKDVIRGLQCQADGFIPKSYDMEFLLARIEYVLVNRRLRRPGAAELGMEVYFSGRQHRLTSDRMQIIDLLLSTFEHAVNQTSELEHINAILTDERETIKRLEKNYRTLLETASEAMLVVSRDGEIIYANPAGEAILGRGESLVGRPFRFPLEPGEPEEFTLDVGGRQMVVELRIVECSWGGAATWLATLKDITTHVELRRRLAQLSMTDELTGLNNRRGFATHAEQQLRLARRRKDQLTLLYLDLDGLKTVNDTLGHAVGDLLLLDLSSLLRTNFRDSDVIGRLGGDEFAVLAVDASARSIEAATQRLDAAIEQHNQRESRPRYRLSVSVGAVEFDPESGESLDSLSKRADALMYEQKRRRQEALGPRGEAN